MEEDDPMYEVVRKGNEKERSQIDENSHDGPSVRILYNKQDIAATTYKASATDYIKKKPGEEALKEMYAVVNKKVKVEKEESDPPIPPHVIDEYCSIQAIKKDPKSGAIVEGEEASAIPHNTVEELYTVVKKNPKKNKKEEVAPQYMALLPPHTVEELYTAVIKKSKSDAEDKEQTPPPHSVEELYTTVVKKPKGNSEDEDKAPTIPPHVEEEYRNLNNPDNDPEEVAPPIQSYTVEELYTAVVKKPKESVTDDGEEAPPIPPYTVDKLSCSSGDDKQ
jgi:hypothetical protein